MEQLEWVIKIGAALGAVAVIWRIFSQISRIPQYLKDMHRHTFENYMAILRITVMDPHMPLGERILAGQKYLETGGNGEVRKYAVEELHVTEAEGKEKK
ncbi:MAG: hypothetical protein E7408_01175 [Ruminococcaceae bacterium]|nr:hypothetical protein [Oscillospiraceae bacterium]